ncbi:AAA family ATPase [Variovorax sp. GT1P44]|uniref:ATP-binding sensor histidine kinase n=1 Tax=Variovorax sp. GT1P44 TaxID=3443742 RepID=UPI003F45960A
MAEDSEYVLEPLREGADFTLYRGRERGNEMAILARAVAAEHPSPQSLQQLNHEYSLATELDAEWAAQPLALTRHQGRAILLLKDPGGEPLDRVIEQRQGQPFALTRFLRIAIGLAAALTQAHRQGLVHKDIKPANALVDDAGRAWLTGFGFASRLPRERQAPAPPEIIAGTLAYMAPEQTGRMNRSIDSRSDLYSLGITLYQLLTGALPFEATDPLELVHCHIARQPASPRERTPDIPRPVASIIMKLLGKIAEERYQTAVGLAHDLRRCLEAWTPHGRIDDFTLGEHDMPDRLLIPEKLYGRTSEIHALLASFDRVVGGGRPELILVSGYSGVGKSSVVNELHKPLVPPRGFFASGKFDQYKRDIPYATLAHALQSLIRPILSTTEEELARWRFAIREALGANGQLVVDLVPKLQHIIGEQPRVPQLPPQDAQRRFQLVLRRFIGVFTRQHPLALFLDDLQWIDAATLDLMEDLLTHPDVSGLMLIGAYRDNEVGSEHPLMRKLQAMRQAGVILQNIVLAPLTRYDLGQLIADSLHCESGQAGLLAGLVEEKTNGNPFFSIQFISSLFDEGLLNFNHGEGRWFWELDRIHAKGYTDNVVDLMVSKLRRLPAGTQKAIQQLACLGNSADVAMVSRVYQESSEEIHDQLWEAVRTGFIHRSEGSYGFLHDRVQEAAYSLIPPELRAEKHLRIGMLMAAHTPPDKLREEIFEIVNQLNRGAHLLTDAGERERVAGLNRIAGHRAMASTAYASALTYLHAGRALLTEEVWGRNYELVFSIESLLAECELHGADMVAAEGRLATLAQRATGHHDFAIVTRLRITLYTTLDRSDRAIEVLLDYLRRNGTVWSRHPARDDVMLEYNRIWSLVRDRQIEDLVDLPLLEDPDVLDMLDVFAEVVHPAMFFDENLSTLVVCRIVSSCLQYGNCDAACFGYVWFGMFAGPRFNNYKDGFRFGQLGHDLVEKRNLTRYQARTYISFGTLTPWAKHAAQGRELIRRAFDVAYRTGDLTFSAYSWHALITNYLAVGDPLSKAQAEVEKGLIFVRKAGFGLVAENCGAQLGLIRTLRGLTSTFGCFDADDYSESDTEHRLASNPALALAEFFYWTRKLQARFFAGEYASAVEAARKAHPLLWPAASQVETADFRFYAALAHAGAWNSASSEERQEHLAALSDHHRQIEIWALHCPANFGTRTALISAEIARIEDRKLDAENFYESAISSAAENDFAHCEAVANECAAQFYLTRGFDKIARVYLQDARDCYLRWGADAKVRQLEQSYPQIKARTESSGASAIFASVKQLDLATVVRVSEAVSGEIEHEKLIDTLMRTAIEHAGAERGLLILMRGGEPRIEAEATTGVGKIEVATRHAAAITSSDLPLTVLQYAIRTQERVLLDDASSDNVYANDEYLHLMRSRSVLCVPIVKQKKLVGALYLENNLSPGVFTSDRVAILDLLASQASISLENAALYTELQIKVGLLHLLPVSAWTLNPDGTPDFVNQVWLEFSGQTLDFVRSYPDAWMTAIHPEDRELATRAFWAGVRSGQGFAFETRSLRAQDGTYRWHLQQAVVLRDEEGKVLRFVGTTTDIDDQKRTEEALRVRESNLLQITETIPEMLWSASPDGVINYCNGRFLDYTGFSTEQLMREGWMKVLHSDDVGPTEAAWRSCVKSGAPFRVEVRTFHSVDHTYRWCVTKALPLLDPEGRIVKWHGTVVDMHEWKQAQEDLRRTQADLAHVARVATLNAMTASLAHEVSQPLSGILTNANTSVRMLAADPPDLSGAAKTAWRTIRDANRAAEVIRRLRAMFSKTPPTKDKVDLNDAAREVIALSADELHRKRAFLQVDFAEELPLISADRVQLQQVILNLLLNAADAMAEVDDRPRTLLVKTMLDEDDDGGVRLAVRDSGTGVDPRTVEKLFEAFYTTKAHGMGVGLSICRSIIESHDGRLWAMANDGPGATFSFCIPCATH